MGFRQRPLVRSSLFTCALLPMMSLSSAGCGGGSEPEIEAADVVLLSGVIHTMDEAATSVEAMAIRDGRILYAGDNDHARLLVRDETQVIELQGRVVLPGFHDAHTHLLWSAADLLNVDLFEVSTVEGLQQAVIEWATANPEAPWIQGGGWAMSDFEGILHKSQLDEVTPDRPAILYSADGHTAFVSSLALSLAGITAETPDPEDGRIERDENGEPTGVLQESAMDLVAVLVPGYPQEQIDEGLAMGLWEANSFGVTTIIDAASDDWILEGYRRAEDNGSLTVRVHNAVEVSPEEIDAVARLEGLRADYESDRVKVSQAKFFVDGIIESQTAYMLEPYLDGSSPDPNFTSEELVNAAIGLDAAGFQLHAHAIGDGAVRQFLDAVEALDAVNGEADRRPLVAHLEVIDPDDVPRFAALGALADFQPLWAYPDPYITELTWPVIGEERSEWLYPMGAVLEAGGTLVAGSDYSVSSQNPFEAIEVAVTRQDPWEDAGDILTPQHRISVLDALRAYTSDGAKASFSEDSLGSLEEGKRADFIIVDRDPLTVDPHELSDLLVMETWLDGQRVYQVNPSLTRAAPLARRPHAAGCRHGHRQH